MFDILIQLVSYLNQICFCSFYILSRMFILITYFRVFKDESASQSCTNNPQKSNGETSENWQWAVSETPQNQKTTKITTIPYSHSACFQVRLLNICSFNFRKKAVSGEYLEIPGDDRIMFRFEAAWDSSLHNSPLLNRVTSPGEQIFMTISAYLEVSEIFFLITL